MLNINNLTDNEEFAIEDDEFEDDFEAEAVDEFYDMAVLFARLSVATSVSAKRRRIYARLSDLCDRVSLAQGSQRELLAASVVTSLAKLEKSLGAETRFVTA